MSDPTNTSSATTATFLTALVFNGAVAGAEILAFTFLRPYFKQIYEPRTLVPITSQRVKPFVAGMFTWPIALLKANYQDIMQVNGPDAYFFVRFLRMMVRILLPIWIISWIVLLPTTSAGTLSTGKTGLDRFIFGNVPATQQDRYAAHIILVWIFTFWIFWNIRYEMRKFITARQIFLISPEHSSSVQANTILVTGIPAKFLSEEALRKMYSHLPGGVKKIWINRDLKELPDIYDRRLAASGKLESAETTLITTAAKLRAEQLEKDAKAGKDGSIAETVDAERDLSLVEKLVPKNKRPTHRLPAGFMPFSLPLIGKEVDSIDWARKEIATTNVLLERGREAISQESPLPEPEDTNGDGKVDSNDRPVQTYPPLSSAFVTFNQQIAAHLAVRALTHHEPYRMHDKYVEVAPEDVIWGNLGLNPYEQKARLAISYAATAGLIILWAFPVAFVGIISNIKGLCVRAAWLAWLCKIPAEVIGIIQGVLPPVLLAVLMMLLPIILRLLGRFEGIPTKNGLELSLMTRFFIFQVIHSFLIVTISSGIIAALPGLLKNPTGIPSLLAQYLPQASTFFLTYILLQGLSGVAGGFLSIVTLALYYVKLFILGSTPRSIYNIKYGARSVAWGTLFPSMTLLVVITFGYSIISPIINGFACAAFFLFYQLYKFLFLYQYTQPTTSETGGLFFPKAIQHVFVGMYVQQLCLCALFFLAQNADNKQSAVPEGALMVVLIVFTAAFHAIINNSFGPLIHALPLSLADRAYRQPEPTSTTEDDANHMDVGQRPINEKAGGSGSNPTSPISPTTPGGQSKYASWASGAPITGGSYSQHVPGERVDYGFAHPATSRPQRVVWIPLDDLGLGAEEVEACREAGVMASTEGAMLDSKRNVEITEPPPDEGKV